MLGSTAVWIPAFAGMTAQSLETPLLHIGILAHSAEGATLCYRTAWLEGIARLGPHMHPEITLTGVAMHHSLDAWERDDRQALRAIFMADAAKLAAAGADFFVLPDNTAHIALEAPGKPFPIPALHIAEVVADQTQREGRKRSASSAPIGRCRAPFIAARSVVAISAGKYRTRPTARRSTR